MQQHTQCDFFIKHILFLEGYLEIEKVKRTNQPVTLDSMIPMELEDSLEETASVFTNALYQQKKTDFSASDIWKSLVQAHRSDIIKTTILFLFINGMRIFYGWMAVLMFSFFDEKDEDSLIWSASLLSGGLFLNNCLVGNGYYQVGILAVKMKGTLFNAIYNFVLSISPSQARIMEDRIISTVTQFHNLMEDNGLFIFRTITAPLPLLGLTALLVYRLGWHSLGGVAFCLLFVILQFCYAYKNAQHPKSRLKQKRMQVLTEIVTSLKYIKMLMWESIFLKTARSIRRQQKKSNLQEGVDCAVEVALGEGVTLITIILALSAIRLGTGSHFNSQITMETIFLMLLIRKIIEYISTGISCYFKFNALFEEVAEIYNIKTIPTLPPQKQRRKSSSNLSLYGLQSSCQNDSVIQLKSVNCSYKSYNEWHHYILKNINLTIRKGEFVTVLGKVGSGKTSLLDCLAGQFSFVSGDVFLKEDLAYVLQESVVFQGNLKKNIILDQKTDEHLYVDILRECSLIQEAPLLSPFQDEAEMEKEESFVSVGERIRIGLARALYSRRPILLIDDVLSNLDVAIAWRIIEYLHRLCKQRGYTVVMATHSLYHIKEEDRILLLENKTIKQITKKDIALLYSTDDTVGTTPVLAHRKKRFLLFEAQDHEEILNGSDLSSEEDEVQQRAEEGGESEERTVTVQAELKEPQLICKLAKYIFSSKSNWVVFPVTVFLYLLSEGLLAYSYYLLSQYSDIIENKQPDYSFLHHYGDIYLVMAGLLLVFHWLRTYGLAVVIQNSNQYLYRRAISALLHSSRLCNKQHSPKALDVFSQDLSCLDDSLLGMISEQLSKIFQCTCQLILLAIYSPIHIVFGVLMVLTSILVYEHCAFVILAQRRLSLSLKSAPIRQFSQLLRNLKSVKIYNLEEMERQQIEKALFNSMQSAICSHKTLISFMVYMQGILLVLEISMMFTMIHITKYANMGVFCSSLISLFELFEYFDWILCNSIFATTALTSIDRIQSFVHDQQQNRETLLPHSYLTPPCSPLHFSDYAIDIRNLSLRYRRGGEAVLSNIEVRIKQGNRIAIVGKTASGKSSFLRTLYRLFEPELNSEYFLFGQNALTMPLSELRNHFSCITQHPFVFRDTIRKNIDPFDNYSDGEIKAALEEVKMLDKIQMSQGGIYSSLTNNTIDLSFGQKQLICMARVLLKQRPLLILDEAFSSIDHRTDAIIQSILRTKLKGTTIICVDSKITNVLDYDEIWVFEEGRIVERGNSKQLFRLKGQFYEMVTQNQELSMLSEVIIQKQISQKWAP